MRADNHAVLIFYFEDEQLLREDAAVVEEKGLDPLEWEPVGSARAGNVLRMNLSGIEGRLHAVAVNTLEPYEEVEIGEVAGVFEWEPPARGDWAIAVERR